MSDLRELDRAEFRHDFHSDLLLLLCVLVMGVIVGWRGYYLTHDYNPVGEPVVIHSWDSDSGCYTVSVMGDDTASSSMSCPSENQ